MPEHALINLSPSTGGRWSWLCVCDAAAHGYPDALTAANGYLNHLADSQPHAAGD